MRISDDRYTRDRLRFDLALRMIHHEARTCTIRTWTGLTDDRIRKLYRTYLQQQFVISIGHIGGDAQVQLIESGTLRRDPHVKDIHKREFPPS